MDIKDIKNYDEVKTKLKAKLVEDFLDNLYIIANSIAKKYNIYDEETREDLKQDSVVLFYKYVDMVSTEHRSNEEIKAYLEQSIRLDLEKKLRRQINRTRQHDEYSENIHKDSFVNDVIEMKTDIEAIFEKCKIDKLYREIFFDYIQHYNLKKKSIFLRTKYQIESKRLTNIIQRLKRLIKNQLARSISNIGNNPTKETIIETVEKINKSNIIDEAKKRKIVKKLQKTYISVFNFDNCPEDYQTLKNEAKFFSGMTNYSFLLMAQRLLRIRDNKLYKNDGYETFREFIDKEIALSERTVYNYIDILKVFELQTFAILENVNHSKLVKVIPLLKAHNESIPKDELKRRFLSEIQTKSAREIEKEVVELKKQYGLIKENEVSIDRIIEDFLKRIPTNISVEDKSKLQNVIDFIQRINLTYSND